MLRLKNIRIFFNETATFLDSGVPIREALESLARSRHEALARFAGRLAAHVGSGESLAQGMRQPPVELPSGFIAAIDAGERSGTLPDILRKLVDEIDHQINLRSRLLLRLAYPVGVFFCAIVLVPLPLVFEGKGLTYVLYETAAFGALLLSTGIVSLAIRARRQSSPLYRSLEALVLAVPYLGPALLHLSSGRALHLFGILLQAGLSLGAAAPLVAQSVRVQPVLRFFVLLEERIRGGQSIADIFGETSVFPESVHIKVQTGEGSGTLDRALLESSRELLEEAWRRIDLIARLLPVVIYLVLGLLVLDFALDTFAKL